MYMGEMYKRHGYFEEKNTSEHEHEQTIVGESEREGGYCELGLCKRD